jgi:hypothetical protein
MIVPSCAGGLCGFHRRVGANRSWVRISRNTRRGDVRIPATRNRAQTLRYPSQRNGDACRTVRMCPPGHRLDRARRGLGAVGAPRASVGANRRSNGAHATSDRHGPGGRWRARWPGSSSRPPVPHRAVRLQPSNLLVEELNGHGRLPQLLPESAELAVAFWSRPLFHGLENRNFTCHLSAAPSGAPSQKTPVGHPHVARRRPLRARRASGSPSPRLQPATVARSTAWRG